MSEVGGVYYQCGLAVRERAGWQCERAKTWGARPKMTLGVTLGKILA